MSNQGAAGHQRPLLAVMNRSLPASSLSFQCRHCARLDVQTDTDNVRRHQPPGCTPNNHASALKLAKASTVLLMMMRATRPESAP